MNFSFDFYKSILKYLSDLGFKWESFSNYSKKGAVYLRHDIDIFLENVLNIAKIEKDMSAKAIYFFQPNCEFYNLLSPSSLKIIEKLSLFGHEIGLHIDASLFEEIDQLVDYIKYSYDFYRRYIPLTNIISFHRPPKFVMNSFEIEGFKMYTEKIISKKYGTFQILREEIFQDNSLIAYLRIPKQAFNCLPILIGGTTYP